MVVHPPGPLTYLSGGHSTDDGIRLNITSNDSAGTHYSPFAHRNALQNGCTNAQPGIIANADGQIASREVRRTDGMTAGDEPAIVG